MIQSFPRWDVTCSAHAVSNYVCDVKVCQIIAAESGVGRLDLSALNGFIFMLNQIDDNWNDFMVSKAEYFP